MLEVDLLLILVVVVAGVVCSELDGAPSGGSGGRSTSNTSGFFVMGKSCGEVRAGRNREMVKFLFVEKPVWLETTTNATLQSRNGRDCDLEASVIYKVRRSNTLDVVGEDLDTILCSYPRDTDLQLLKDEVYVSCIQDKESAEEELISIMVDSARGSGPATAPTSGLGHTTEELLQPRGPKQLNFDTSIGKDQTTTPGITETFQLTKDWRMYVTPEILSEDMITSQETAVLESTSYTPDKWEETEGNENNLTSADEVEGIGNPTVLNAFTVGYDTQLSSQNSSEMNEQESSEHLPYFIGAGTGVVLLVIGIIVIIYIVQKRKPKRKAEENIEDFFIVGSTNGQEEKDGYHNAEIMMYSGGEREEAVESFELEERILKGPVSSHELDTPKCLRAERIQASTCAKGVK